jgi:hypothetical protein
MQSAEIAAFAARSFFSQCRLRGEEICDGVFFYANAESFGDNDLALRHPEACLVAVRGTGLVKESVWAAALALPDLELTAEVAIDAAGQAQFSDHYSDGDWRTARLRATQIAEVLIFVDCQDADSAIYPFLCVCPEAHRGLARVEHGLGRYVRNRHRPKLETMGRTSYQDFFDLVQENAHLDVRFGSQTRGRLSPLAV